MDFNCFSNSARNCQKSSGIAIFHSESSVLHMFYIGDSDRIFSSEIPDFNRFWNSARNCQKSPGITISHSECSVLHMFYTGDSVRFLSSEIPNFLNIHLRKRTRATYTSHIHVTHTRPHILKMLSPCGCGLTVGIICDCVIEWLLMWCYIVHNDIIINHP